MDALGAHNVRWRHAGRRRDIRPAPDCCRDCQVDLSEFIPIYAGIGGNSRERHDLCGQGARLLSPARETPGFEPCMLF